MFSKLSILIPACNEADTIKPLLVKIRNVVLPDGIKKETIVVNDGSADDTERAVFAFCQEFPDMPVRYFRHMANKGKGAAIHTGLQYATGEYVVIQDADLEYDPEDYALLLQPVLQHAAKVVYGSRFKNGCPRHMVSRWQWLGNRWLTTLSNQFNRLALTDMETCYKLFSTTLLRELPLREKRFGFEPEVTARIARLGNIRIYETDISYTARTPAEGKKIGWKDGVRAVYCILKYSPVFQKKEQRILENGRSPPQVK